IAIKAAIKTVSAKNANFGLKVRCGANDDGYTVYFAGGKIGIGKKSNGTWRVLKETASQSPLHEMSQLAVVLHGDQIVAYVNGKSVLTVSDNELKSGSVGVMAYNSAAIFHDIQIQRIPQKLPLNWHP
ncbi:MAG: hypothetical protein R3C49_25270, partial [Planctomycetaceae bacterium]